MAWGAARPRKRVPAIGSMIVVGAGIMMVVAMVGVIVAWSGILDKTYIALAFQTPGFDYTIVGGQEDGNETFKVFQGMRILAFGLFVVVLVFAGLAKFMESTETGIMQQGTANRMISKSLLFMLVIMVFPPLWDELAAGVTNVSYWVLNPLYSFDDDSPCVAGVDARAQVDGNPYILGSAPNTFAEMESVCRPEFKVTYVFGQMLRATEDSIPPIPGQPAVPPAAADLIATDGGNVVTIADQIKGEIVGPAGSDANIGWMGDVQGGIQRGEDVFKNMFLMLTKALVALQVLILSIMIGIMADMLVGMIIAALPLFLMLSLIPRVEEFANKMINALPALLLLPLMSAAIIVVGAATIAEAGGQDAAVDGFVYTWITSMAVVFFAVTLPVILVPILGNVTTMATQVVSSAVQSGAMITGMAVSSAATAAHDASRGGKGLGGGALAALKGLGAGAMGGIASAGVPGMGGVGVDAKSLAGGVHSGAEMGHGVDPASAALMSPRTQDAAISKAITDSDATHRGEESSEAMDDRLPEGDKASGDWNEKTTSDEKHENVMDKLDQMEMEGRMDADLADAASEFRGPMGNLQRSLVSGTLDDGDLDEAFNGLVAENGDLEGKVAESRVKDQMINDLVEQNGEKGFTAKKIREMIDRNSMGEVEGG